MSELACALFDNCDIDRIRLTCQEQHNRHTVTASDEGRPYTPSQEQSAKVLAKASAPWFRNPDRLLHRLVEQYENLQLRVAAEKAEEDVYHHRLKLLREPLDALQRAACNDSTSIVDLVDQLTIDDAEAATKARERLVDTPRNHCPKRTELLERAAKAGVCETLISAALQSADATNSIMLVRAIYEMLKLGSKYTPAFVPAAHSHGAHCVDGPLGRGVYSTHIRRRTIGWMTVLDTLPPNANGVEGLWRLQDACRDQSDDEVATSTVFQYSPFQGFVDTVITNAHQRPLAELCIAGAVLGIEVPSWGSDENIGVVLAQCVQDIYAAMASSDIREARRRAQRHVHHPVHEPISAVDGIPSPVVIGPVNVCEGHETDWMFAYDQWELSANVCE